MAQQFLKNPLPPPSKLQQWPNVPAQKGLFYGVTDPVFRKDQLVVMLAETWTEVGTIIESGKRTMAMQDKVVTDLKAANGALAAQLNDMREKYDNLSAAYRAMKRAQLTKDNPELAAADALVDAGNVPPTSFL